jgi:hypothetical protein
VHGGALRANHPHVLDHEVVRLLHFSLPS